MHTHRGAASVIQTKRVLFVLPLQVVKLRNGTFVMFFPAMANPREHGGVGVASAAHPAGPFVQASAGALPGTSGADDPTVYVDTNGQCGRCV